MREIFKIPGTRRQAVIILLTTVLAGFYSKFYSGIAQDWINNSLGGIFYEVFWCIITFLFFDTLRAEIIAASVLLITCLLEFFQLCHFPALEFIRKYFIGKVIIGTSFSWSDFPYYFIGSGIGWILIRYLQKSKIINT